MPKKLTCILLAQLSVALLSPSSHAGEPGKSADIPLEEQPQELVRHVVWDDDRPLVPHFLPAAILQSEGLQGVAVDSSVVDGLADHMDFVRRRKAAGKSVICEWSSEDGFSTHETPDGQTVVDVLRRQDIVALGHVRAVVPGWAFHRPVTMVYVGTEELLYCREGFGQGYEVRDFAPGETVATTLKVGGFELDGLPICSRTPDNFVVPKIGDRVVVGGSPRPGDQYFIGHGGPMFVVESGEVLPQPYEGFRWERVPLESLREDLGGSLSSCTKAQ